MQGFGVVNAHSFPHINTVFADVDLLVFVHTLLEKKLFHVQNEHRKKTALKIALFYSSFCSNICVICPFRTLHVELCKHLHLSTRNRSRAPSTVHFHFAICLYIHNFCLFAWSFFLSTFIAFYDVSYPTNVRIFAF